MAVVLVDDDVGSSLVDVVGVALVLLVVELLVDVLVVDDVVDDDVLVEEVVELLVVLVSVVVEEVGVVELVVLDVVVGAGVAGGSVVPPASVVVAVVVDVVAVVELVVLVSVVLVVEDVVELVVEVEVVVELVVLEVVDEVVDEVVLEVVVDVVVGWPQVNAIPPVPKPPVYAAPCETVTPVESLKGLLVIFSKLLTAAPGETKSSPLQTCLFVDVSVTAGPRMLSLRRSWSPAWGPVTLAWACNTHAWTPPLPEESVASAIVFPTTVTSLALKFMVWKMATSVELDPPEPLLIVPLMRFDEQLTMSTVPDTVLIIESTMARALALVVRKPAPPRCSELLSTTRRFMLRTEDKIAMRAPPPSWSSRPLVMLFDEKVTPVIESSDAAVSLSDPAAKTRSAAAYEAPELVQKTVLFCSDAAVMPMYAT
jgi:hypothetical protein